VELFRRKQGNKGLIPADTRLDTPAPDPVGPRSNALSWRDDWFFFYAAWIIAAVVVYGFAQTVSQRLLHASVPRPLILWLHAGVFVGWLCIFILQTTFVRIRRVRWHRTLGVAGLLLGAAMVVLGVTTTLVMGHFDIVHGLRDPDSARAHLAIPLNDMIFFASAVAAAAWWRKRPEVHRRLIFIASCLLTAAAFPRFPFSAVRALPGYAGVDLLLLVGIAYDFARHGRIHRVYALALPPIIVGQSLALWLVLKRPAGWLQIGQHLIG
jgi:hypothetical protein